MDGPGLLRNTGLWRAVQAFGWGKNQQGERDALIDEYARSLAVPAFIRGGGAVRPSELADIVGRVHDAWLAGPCRLWLDVESIQKTQRSDAGAQVAFALYALYFEFNYLFGEGHRLLREIEQHPEDGERLQQAVEGYLAYMRAIGTRCVDISDYQCGRRKNDGSSPEAV